MADGNMTTLARSAIGHEMKLLSQILIMATVIAALTGCGAMRKEVTDTPASEAVAQSPDTEITSQTSVHSAGSKSSSPANTQPELLLGEGSLIDANALKQERVPVTDGTVTLNFDGADLKEVVDVVLGETLGLGYMLDPSVSGVVNFRTSGPISHKVALEALEIILRMNAAALVQNGNVLTIVPADKAPASALPPRLLRDGGDVPPGYAIALIPLEHISASRAQVLVESFMPADAIKRVDTERNLLLVAGSGPDLSNIVQTVKAFDVDWLKSRSIGIFPLKHTSPETIIDELSSILNTKTNGESLVRLLPIERQNSVIAVTTSQSLLTQIEQWIVRLDSGSGEGERLFVYYVQNAKAVDLAEVLTSLFGGNTASNREARGGLAPGREAVKVDEDGVTEASPADVSSIRLSQSNEIRFIAEEKTNALMIVASPADYRLIEAAIKKIDIEPLQVLIEATIAEVTLGDEIKFGLQWAFESGSLGIDGGFSEGVLSSGNSSSLAPAFPGFSFILSDATGARAVLDAISTQTEVDVISSPSLLVLDNQTANLQIGDEVPITTQQRQSTTDPDAPVINSIEFRDTGVILNVTPNVSSSGNVILEIEQEVSNVSESSDSGVLTPTISQRKVNTVVSVRSGETIVLGGLISNLKSRSKSGIPVLSDIPVLGSLFGGRQIKSTRKELILLLTPKVLASPDETRQATEELKAKLNTLKTLEEEGDVHLLLEVLTK